MVQRILVLGKNGPYDFVPEGGTRMTGQKVHFIFRDGPLSGEGAGGYAPVSASVPVEEANKLTVLPGIYQAGFSIQTVGGKPQLKLVSIDGNKPVPVEL